MLRFACEPALDRGVVRAFCTRGILLLPSSTQSDSPLSAPTRAFRNSTNTDSASSSSASGSDRDTPKGPGNLLPLTVTDLSRDDLTGLSLGPWRPGRKLGQGGMGQVFAASHETLGRSFAIKFLTAGLSSSQEASRRFQDEIRSLGQMQHPNIVSAVDAGAKNGVHYLVTDFIAGRTLAEVVASEGPREEQRVIEIAGQVAAGLAHAHKHGFVHRDIKPSNLMLDESGNVRILDFGIARHTSGTSSLTADGQMLGTAEFLAPEQAADAQSVDGRSDLYSLGGTLLFLLTGETPFPKSSHPTFASQIHAHLFETPPALKHAPPAWSPRLLELLSRLLARNPDERFANAEAVVEFLSEQSTVNPAQRGRLIRWASFVTMSCAILLCSLVLSAGAETDGSDSKTVQTASMPNADQPASSSTLPNPASTATVAPSDDPAPLVTPTSEPPAPTSQAEPAAAATVDPELMPTETVSGDAVDDSGDSTELLDVQTVNTNPARSAGRAPATFPGKLSGGSVRHKPGIRSGAPQ